MMVGRRTLIGALALPFVLAGCASPDRVVFVTMSEVGIGYDATAGTANIGFDRNEAVIGPDYPETGGIPPVYARLRSSGDLFSPGVDQLYATGKAARLATSGNGNCTAPTKEKSLSGNRRVAIFGTSTNVGLKIHLVRSAVPDSINFGYKRKEFSWVPLRSELGKDEKDSYPSLLARVKIGTNVTRDSSNVAYDIYQFMATGSAAENLACQPDIKEVFKNQALENVKKIPPAVVSEADGSQAGGSMAEGASPPAPLVQ